MRTGLLEEVHHDLSSYRPRMRLLRLQGRCHPCHSVTVLVSCSSCGRLFLIFLSARSTTYSSRLDATNVRMGGLRGLRCPLLRHLTGSDVIREYFLWICCLEASFCRAGHFRNRAYRYGKVTPVGPVGGGDWWKADFLLVRIAVFARMLAAPWVDPRGPRREFA